jgi:CBS domain-containing protein
VPVVERGKPVGMMTNRDLIRAQAKLFARAASKSKEAPDEDRVVTVRVRETMGKELLTCPPDTAADDAARLMLDHRIGCILVVEDERLIGIVSESDVMKWAVEVMAKTRFEAG